MKSKKRRRRKKIPAAGGAAVTEADRKAQQAEFSARERRMFRGWMRYGDEGLTDEERKIVNTRRQIRQKAMEAGLDAMNH
jgi:hypothetical protein